MAAKMCQRHGDRVEHDVREVDIDVQEYEKNVTLT